MWFGTISWKEKQEIEKRRMSDRSKSGMSCPPLRPCRLSSCYSLPKYNLIWGWRHLAFHTRACKMTSTAVWPCITCLEGQQGSLSFNNMEGMGVLMTHVMGIIMAHSPALRQFISLSLQVMLSREQWGGCVASFLIVWLFHLLPSSRTTDTSWYKRCNKLKHHSLLPWRFYIYSQYNVCLCLGWIFRIMVAIEGYKEKICVFISTCKASPRSAVLISGSSVVLKGTGVILTKVRTRGSGYLHSITPGLSSVSL